MSSPTQNNPDTYWANLPSDELPPQLMNKVSNFYEYMSRFGILDRLQRCYMSYYGMSMSGTDTTDVNQAGVNGELYVLKVNHFRSLLQNILVLITQQLPAIQPKASNTDSKSMNQTILAKSVIDYYMKEQDAERYFKEAAEFALFGGEGWITLTWDALAGQEAGINPDTGRPFYDGDAKFRSYHTIDIIRECYSNSNDMPRWYIVRDFENKYDLATRYPEHAAEIVNISKSPDYMSNYHYMAFDVTDADDIPTYTFYHEATDACPNGRMMKFLTNDLWLTDTALPYKHMPIYGMRPARWFGTPFGYTVAYDLMGIQRAFDSLQSVIATNQMNYGIQNILIERGSEVNVVALAQGLNAIETNPGTRPPEALNLVKTPPEIFNQGEAYIRYMETLSAINSTARGMPEESLKSGTALALVASQAIQANSGLQNSYNNLIQDSMTGLVEILQQFANTPRIAAIAGKSNRSRVREFKGEDLKNISRVVCETVNPISKTAAGRLQMAQDLLQIPGMITTPQHYFEVIETGTLEPLLEHQTSQMVYIRSENEELAEGRPVRALLTDDQLMHIHEHSTVLDSVDARSSPQIVEQTLAHIHDHLTIFEDPANYKMLLALGQNPPPPAPMPLPGATQPEASPPDGPRPQPGPSGPNLPPAGVLPQQLKAAQVKAPKLPSLPNGAPPDLQASYDKLKGNLSS